MAINPRPVGTRPAPSKKTRPVPPRLCNRVSGRVFKLKRVFNRVLNGSGFIKKPESDPNYFFKNKKPENCGPEREMASYSPQLIEIFGGEVERFGF
jgi:hypothetical protein